MTPPARFSSSSAFIATLLLGACSNEAPADAPIGSTSGGDTGAVDTESTAPTDEGPNPADSGDEPGTEDSGGGSTGGDDTGGGVPEDGGPFPLWDGAGGATRDSFNREASLDWRNPMGDWRDADGVDQGEASLAEISVPDSDEQQLVTIDLTATIADDGVKWLEEGILLRIPVGGAAGGASFHSREAGDPLIRPRLVIAAAGGETVELEPAADATLNPSTYQGLGTEASFNVSGTNHAVLRFEGAGDVVDPTSVELVLTTTDRQYGAATVGAYYLVARRPEYLPKTTGLAADFDRDQGIEGHPDVFMATRFETDDWCDGFAPCSGSTNGSARLTTEDEAPEEGFEPLDGTALRVHYFANALSATNQHYNFIEAGDGEQEEVYFRYYLRFGLDWIPIVDGGKMPGLATTDALCGSGGAPSDGRCGWTLRGSFKIAMSPDNPLFPRNVIGTYAYHGRMTGDYGDGWRWQQYGLGAIPLGTWVCIEQHVKVNTPGESDGVFEVWIDGHPAFVKTDVFLRDVPPYPLDGDLGVHRMWGNHYHGGTSPTTVPLTLFMDNVVIAKSRIGCTEGL